ncbi:ELL-associated factor 1 isoform X1 [Rhipicephalus sanguineus]|uniref:ELL-associated factor 1 isoform X1 n=1 Tax=Rhipicephalus sanguineus TaxID=34632 RepID=UPI0018938AA7|nr:ELL-associated factor 1 isoform X1 [Rhipicephalus sanguineus]
MHSGTADRLRIGNEVRELKLGRSFSSSSGSAFHSIRYDFKPASVDTSKSANVEVGEKNQITVTVPHIENPLSQGSGTAHTVFKGSQRPYQRECVLVVDNVTGEVTLERLSCNIQLKKTRAEGSSKIQPRPITPIDSGSSGGGGSRKHSPSQKLSPPQPQTNGKHSWSSSSPNGPQQSQSQLQQRTSQQPRISPSQPQVQRSSPPGSQSSPSMPTLLTPREGGGSSSRAPSASRDSMPLLTTETLHDGQEEVPDVGVLSDSSDSSNSTSKSSASSDSSDSEHEDAPPTPQKNSSSQPSHSSRGHHAAVNGTNGQHSNNASLSMPRFSQLSEDLHLSESGSDSDD